MKKVLVTSLLLAMLLSLCGCGKSSEVKTSERLIADLETAERITQRQLDDAASAFFSLSEKDQKKVENMATLLSVEETVSQTEASIEEANELFEQFDVAGAIDLLNSLVPKATVEQLEEIESMGEEIKNSCYEGTYFLKVENVLTHDGDYIVDDNTHNRFTMTHDETDLDAHREYHLYGLSKIDKPYSNMIDNRMFSAFDTYLLYLNDHTRAGSVDEYPEYDYEWAILNEEPSKPVFGLIFDELGNVLTWHLSGSMTNHYYIDTFELTIMKAQ